MIDGPNIYTIQSAWWFISECKFYTDLCVLLPMSGYFMGSVFKNKFQTIMKIYIHCKTTSL